MRALVKRGAGVALEEAPEPAVAAPDDVVVAVRIAGVCRTDVAAADGRIAVAEGRVLGHELAGVVVAVGPRAAHVRAGDRVAVMPALACGACRTCARREGARCPRRLMLGIDRDGAFAERVRVPAAAVHRLPDGMAFEIGAYAEPVAAALGVLKAGISRGQRGLVWGQNRIAELTRRVLAAHGIADVAVHQGGAPPEEDAYDFVVETVLGGEALAAMLRAVRPGGTIVLKSRRPEPAALPVAEAVAREVTLEAVGWGPLGEALGLLASGRLEVGDLLAPPRPLEAWAAVLEAARAEAVKPLFAI